MMPRRYSIVRTTSAYKIHCEPEGFGGRRIGYSQRVDSDLRASRIPGHDALGGGGTDRDRSSSSGVEPGPAQGGGLVGSAGFGARDRGPRRVYRVAPS